MSELITLRIGICKCTPLYHGSLENHEFKINGQWFYIQEIEIPERQHTKHIRVNRCHFFIDLHTRTYNPKYVVGEDLFVGLTRFDFLPPLKL